MNPPYQGYVGVSNNGFRTDRAYIFHVMKAILLGDTNKKILYVIIPPLLRADWGNEKQNGIKMIKFKDLLTNDDKNKIKKLFNVDVNKLNNIDVYRIGTVNDFNKIKFMSGKYKKTKFNITTDIYRIEVN